MKKYVILGILGVMVPTMCFGASVRFTQLVREKERKMAELEKCMGSTKGLKIAGLSTLGLTAAGVAANVVEAKKIDEYEKLSVKYDTKIETAKTDLDKAKTEVDDLTTKKTNAETTYKNLTNNTSGQVRGGVALTSNQKNPATATNQGTATTTSQVAAQNPGTNPTTTEGVAQDEADMNRVSEPHVLPAVTVSAERVSETTDEFVQRTDAERQAQINCTAAGGTWDKTKPDGVLSGTCVLNLSVFELEELNIEDIEVEQEEDVEDDTKTQKVEKKIKSEQKPIDKKTGDNKQKTNSTSATQAPVNQQVDYKAINKTYIGIISNNRPFNKGVSERVQGICSGKTDAQSGLGPYCWCGLNTKYSYEFVNFDECSVKCTNWCNKK